MPSGWISSFRQESFNRQRCKSSGEMQIFELFLVAFAVPAPCRGIVRAQNAHFVKGPTPSDKRSGAIPIIMRRVPCSDEYPSLTIDPLLDNHQHDVDAIMRESLESEAKALALYREPLKCAEGYSVSQRRLSLSGSRNDVRNGCHLYLQSRGIAAADPRFACRNASGPPSSLGTHCRQQQQHGSH